MHTENLILPSHHELCPCSPSCLVLFMDVCHHDIGIVRKGKLVYSAFPFEASQSVYNNQLTFYINNSNLTHIIVTAVPLPSTINRRAMS